MSPPKREVDDSLTAGPPLPEGTVSEPVDEPITHLGDDDDDDEENEGDREEEKKNDADGEAAERDEDNDEEDDEEPPLKKAKGKGKAAKDDNENEGEDDNDEGEDEDEEVGAGEGEVKEQPWQAVWAPEQNAYYFWNSETGEVTWTNPLAPPPESAPPLPSGPAPTSQPTQPSQPAYLPSIPSAMPEMDPALAFLLPPEQRGSMGTSGDSSSQGASFNARTGRFTAQDYSYTIGHLDEFNRMKRMNERFFDQEAWEKERAAENMKRRRDEAMGVASNQPVTKKDMARFKKKAAEKKARRQAWLRD